LDGRKDIRPVKNIVVGCWCGYLSGARCRLAYGPAVATATHCLLLQKIQIGFTFLVLAYLGSTGKTAVKWVCVVCTSFCFVTLADASDLKKAISLSGSSVKDSTLAIDVSKKKGNAQGGFTSPRGGFQSPRGAGHQGGRGNRGTLQCLTDYITLHCCASDLLGLWLSSLSAHGLHVF